ncbi:helix-turn-helix domain-containing protein [Candidatus Accumulibacter phosphatis]|jgi:hypothetical protein|uniref:helix-turn-helix domain-containing protein n=1 Tax=Candidatus Accumulibacter phosphatis TaxID=327160 RepID=UPI00110BC1DB|nr:helix-turn-helix domain-containing protein [Candidatus Accumulibacter phosphatis]
MAPRFEVKDFGKKLKLVLRSGKSSRFKRVADVAKELKGVSPDYLSRLVNGTRSLTENVFCQFVDLFGDVELGNGAKLGVVDWHETVETFGKRLGLSSSVLSEIGGVAVQGIDFLSRNKDSYNLRSVHKLIGGYWESFYYSVSTFGKQRISHDLIVIDAPDPQGLMPCRVLDGSFTYEGICFPIHNAFLYLMLEKTHVQDEIIVYLVNRPERERDVELDGIILCTSGGVHDKVAVPCAARVALRHLGATREDMIKQYPGMKDVPPENFEKELRQQVTGESGYLDPDMIEPSDLRLQAVKTLIDNTIPPRKIPFAMRMERGSRIFKPPKK